MPPAPFEGESLKSSGFHHVPGKQKGVSGSLALRSLGSGAKHL
jgi:hypothetical protein